MQSPISNRSMDQLEADLLSLSQQINQHEYQFLVMIREFDIRQGWKPYHFNHCAEWLNMKCGLSLGTAREKVRVARELFDLPLCSQKFENGELSYSKARALTRVATRKTEAELLDHAIGATALQVEERCRRLRNADKRQSTPDARRAFNARSLSRTCHANGTMSIHIELPVELGDIVMTALESMMSDMDSADGSDKTSRLDPEETLFTQQADALVDIARVYLSGDTDSEKSRSEIHQVVVHVDQAALLDNAGTGSAKSDLPIESVRRICCDSEVVEITENTQGDLPSDVLNVGRKHRVVPPKMKQALSARDRHCRFPGCTHTKWLDAHHVNHWSQGGRTDLDNLMMLCSRHHQLLHEGQYTIQKNYQGNWYFRNGDGRILPGVPASKTPLYDPSRDAFEASDQNDNHIAQSQPTYRVNAGESRSMGQESTLLNINRSASRDAFTSPRLVEYCLEIQSVYC